MRISLIYKKGEAGKPKYSVTTTEFALIGAVHNWIKDKEVVEELTLF